MSEILFQPLGNPIAAGENLEHVADIDPRMTRTHYFDGRLLTAEDLERDQIYLDQRLREVGKVLGTGVINGLDLTFDPFTGLLNLTDGQAMTMGGRVLHLGSQLIVSLGDRALISQLNDGQYRKFNRALYAVVLRYVDVATDIAEVFPTDLASKRGSDYALVTESVQLGLVPLPTPLPQQNSLHIRANLIQEFLGNDSITSVIPEDSVALGVIAIANDTPQWLDSNLLRHPLRGERTQVDLQNDLYRQYESLLTDIRSSRLAGSLNNDFAAKEYFNLLPPIGSVPKDSIDPMLGRQRYFPEAYKVHIAPIRLSDLELIKAESLHLPNLDLKANETADIVVLAPLPNQLYGHFAAQLERDYNPSKRILPQLDLLRLKLYPKHPVHAIDTDANVWQAIWNQLDENQLLYIRRPVRAAETAVSGIVLALGTTLPEAPVGGGETPSDPGSVIEDEDTVFLRFVNFKNLAKIRTPQENIEQEAHEKLLNNSGDDAKITGQSLQLMLRIERQYDPVLWRTLAALAENEALESTSEKLAEAEPEPQATGKTILEIISNMGVPEELLKQWEKLIDQFN